MAGTEHRGIVGDYLHIMALLIRLLNDSRTAGNNPATQRLETVP